MEARDVIAIQFAVGSVAASLAVFVPLGEFRTVFIGIAAVALYAGILSLVIELAHRKKGKKG